MKEILFRGKRVDNGEWVYGYYWSNEMGNHFIRVTEEDYNYVIEDYEVFSETVGQFTGLTDKNGKKIFDGDILQDKFGQTKVVDYYDPWGAFRTCFVKALNEEGKIVSTVGGASFVGDVWRKYEVIGNIHDNPELLEKKE